MNRNMVFGLIVIMTTASASATLADDAADKAAVAKRIGTAKVTLQQGLAAGEAQGQVISGKYEVDEGKFQLSVYTAKGAALQEVIVDYTTGKAEKQTPGFRAVSVEPKSKANHPVAMVTLVKGSQFKSVSELLE
jgi:hypothetical protein